MSNKTSFITPSGFAENLPNMQIIENHLKSIIAKNAENYGYVPLETPAVEYLATLSTKGDIQNEIYTLSNAKNENDDSQSKRALRYDLTVPFARYVSAHYSQLVFPFGRYQIQRVWRGEKPQKGRHREFYQADIDIVGNSLPLHYDAEIVLLFSKILTQFNIGHFIMRVNNRRVLQALCEQFAVADIFRVMNLIDKLEKIGIDAFREQILAENIISADVLPDFIAIITKKIALPDVATFLSSIATTETMQTAVLEIAIFCELLIDSGVATDHIVFDLSIVRGLDYYTGTVFETNLIGFEKYGSICSGGRYDNLVERFIPMKLSGVGASIGLTRLLDIIRDEKLLDNSKQNYTKIQISLWSEQSRPLVNALANTLREQYATEVFYDALVGITKQKLHAEKKSIPVCIVPSRDNVNTGTVYMQSTTEREYIDISNLLYILAECKL
jgi:histidyl-tRNA synthetase